MAPTQTIDWSKYQQSSAAPAIDFSKYSDASVAANYDPILEKYGLPKGTDLSKPYLAQPTSLQVDPRKFSAAYAEANPPPPEAKGYLANMWGEAVGAVKGLFSEGTGVASNPPLPGSGAVSLVKSRAEQAKTDVPGALGRTTTDLAIAALPFAGELAGGIWSKVSPASSVEEALGRRLAVSEADTPRPGGQIQPALNNTPREVLQYASKEGIQLTPGQATEDAMAQNLQKAGTTAAVGGKDLTAALNENRAKFGQSVNNLMDTVDPKRMGLSTEQAGETIKQTAQVAKSVAHENATEGYKAIDYLMDQKMEPAPISKAWNTIKQSLPMDAEENILAQTPRSMRAVVEDMLSGRPEGFQPTFSQGIQLRSFFRDMGDTEGLPDKTQAAFKQMSKAVDSAMEKSADIQGATDQWRTANAGWKDYATKYGDPQSVLYKVIRQNDPVRTVTMLQNAPATDIETLKQEGMGAALEPLKRQVLQDIAKSRFNIAHDGLGGYSDSYLRSLFGPEGTKELYVKADLANRLKYDPNPSGTGSNISSISQLGFFNQAKMSAAAKMSMPRDPLSFLPPKPTPAVRATPFATPTAVSPITGGALASPEELFRRAANQ